MVKVKICGIRTLEEAKWAIEAGADALGFVFAPVSKRYVEPAKVQQICVKLPPFVARVGVFVNAVPAVVREIAACCGLSVIQLHGDENPQDYREIALPIIKAVRAQVDVEQQTPGLNDATLSVMARPGQDESKPTGDYSASWLKSVQGVVVDSAYQGNFGGTGRALPWDDPALQGMFEQIVLEGVPLILAGGLNPGNIREAIRKVRPYAVDVSSGVELGGRKDRQLIRDFVLQAKSVEQELRVKS